ncbi:hypothetical protein J7643_16625 [bacterium]|nr:hypothetical protein [bacterium]
MWTYLALAGAAAAAGCQAAPSGTPAGASQALVPTASAERHVQGLDQAGFERMIQALPKQLTNEQADRMLVKLPKDQLRAPLLSDVRRAGYRVSGGVMGYGNGMGYGQAYDMGEGQAYGNGHAYGQDYGNGHAYGMGGPGYGGMVAPPNLDYRFMSIAPGVSSPYITYYPYVYNVTNNHWAPYAAYWSGRYYYPYYQGYGSLYAPYTYSAIMPYGGVYAMRTGTIAR